MNYAIIKDNKVINVIVADSKEIAEEVTGLEAVETTGQPWVNWARIDGQWVEPEPIIDVEEVPQILELE